MKTKTIRIDVGQLARIIAKSLLTTLFFLIIVYPWISYFFLEPEGTKVYPDEEPGTVIQAFRLISTICIGAGFIILIPFALSGGFDYKYITIKMPILFESNNSKYDDDLVELLMQAASLSGEGKHNEADKLYDEIEKIKRIRGLE